MKAEIINVGTELLLGHVVNTNAAWLAREMAGLGINVRKIIMVGDNGERLKKVLKEGLEDNDLLVVTGGLGPTGDDLTKEAAAEVCGKKLVMDETSLQRLKEYFKDRPITENQYKQALAPQGAIIFANEAGTAPGYAIPAGGGKFVILLPGPPREMRIMFESQARPFLSGRSGEVISSAIIRTFGLGEGDGAALLGEMTEMANPTVATYAADSEMFVKVTARVGDEKAAADLAAPIIAEIKTRFGNYVYGVNTPSLAAAVVGLLLERKLTISTAESCTGGLLAKKLTDIAGSSAIFRLGVVTYSNEEKEKILGISSRLIESWGAVSPQVAMAMAKGARRLDGSDYGVGITGIAGPDGGSPEKPVGLVYVCLAFDRGCWIRAMTPRGKYLGREWVRERAAKNALDLVRRHILGLPQEIDN